MAKASLFFHAARIYGKLFQYIFGLILFLLLIVDQDYLNDKLISIMNFVQFNFVPTVDTMERDKG